MKVGEGQSHPSCDSNISQGSPGTANLKVGLSDHDEKAQEKNMKIKSSMIFSISENRQLLYNPIFFLP